MICACASMLKNSHLLLYPNIILSAFLSTILCIAHLQTVTTTQRSRLFHFALQGKLGNKFSTREWVLQLVSCEKNSASGRKQKKQQDSSDTEASIQ